MAFLLLSRPLRRVPVFSFGEDVDGVAYDGATMTAFPPYRRKVRFWDVDAYGHVFNVRYLIYWDDALTDGFAAAGISFLASENGGIEFVVAHLECDYVGEAKLGDELVTTMSVRRIGTTSIVFGLETFNETSGEVVVRGHEVYVVVDAETRKPTPVPETVRAALGPVS